MDDKFNVNFQPTTSPVNQQADRFANIDQGYTGAIAGQTKVPDLINNYDAKYGVPQMQAGIQTDTEQYDTLGNEIRNLPNSIAQRSQESILTQGQKDRQVQAERAPLLEAQGLLGQNIARKQANLGVAQSNASRMVTAEQVQQEKELSPWLRQYDNENVLSSMRMTGWTFENQSELSRLLANQQAGIQLSEAEKNRAHELAVVEKNFQNTLKANEQQNKFTAEQSRNDPNKYITAGAGTSIFDPSTGKFVATAPYKPTASTPKYVPFSGTQTNQNNNTSMVSRPPLSSFDE